MPPDFAAGRTEELTGSPGTKADAADGSPDPSAARPGSDVGLPGAGPAHRWLPAGAMIAYVVCRAVTLLVVAVGDRFTHHGILGDLDLWDGSWFLKAAVHGWPSRLPMVHGHVAPSTLAFFPVFPLAIRALHDATGLSPVLLGVVVSAVTGLIAVVGVGMITRRFAGELKAGRAALLFAVFPGTFVFSLLYSEGIVITCAAFGLLALLRRRWLLAGLLGALATGASPIGLAFVVSCAWCAGVAVVRDRDWRALAAPVLAPVGLVAWMGFLWWHTGVMTAWRLAERGGWQSYPSLVYPLHIVARFAFDPIRPTLTGQILFAGTVVGVVGVVLAVRQHQPAPCSSTASARRCWRRLPRRWDCGHAS